MELWYILIYSHTKTLWLSAYGPFRSLVVAANDEIWSSNNLCWVYNKLFRESRNSLQTSKSFSSKLQSGSILMMRFYHFDLTAICLKCLFGITHAQSCFNLRQHQNLWQFIKMSAITMSEFVIVNLEHLL